MFEFLFSCPNITVLLSEKQASSPLKPISADPSKYYNKVDVLEANVVSLNLYRELAWFFSSASHFSQIGRKIQIGFELASFWQDFEHVTLTFLTSPKDFKRIVTIRLEVVNIWILAQAGLARSKV